MQLEFVYDDKKTRIEEIKLQIRGGEKVDDIRLETVLSTASCMSPEPKA